MEEEAVDGCRAPREPAGGLRPGEEEVDGVEKRRWKAEVLSLSRGGADICVRGEEREEMNGQKERQTDRQTDRQEGP